MSSALEQPAYATSLALVRAAQERVAPFIHRTPVLTSATLDRLSGRSLFFKCEIFQRTGSFKFRGATNAVRMLDDATAARGVVTHSSGNHAQALALAASMRGIAAHVVMPSNSAEIKKAAVRGYGARIIECVPTLEAREATAARVLEETGGSMIPPYNHANVIAGQGTIALELLEQCADLDAIIVPLGGGGLISGITIAAKGINPKIRIIGAEPALAGDAALSKKSGSIQPPMEPVTIADGLRAALGPLTFPIVRDLVDEIALVSEDEIRAHMRLVWERMKITIEPSAAVGVAVACGCGAAALPQRVGVILCGGNVDMQTVLS
ncbi:MAG: pyridoxal-phosphate dependent enzyme [Planctomycetota bacterium]|nr:MAG: pyridoxal-phosphate dependent enzyme [Planctomycetota bacterium]